MVDQGARETFDKFDGLVYKNAGRRKCRPGYGWAIYSGMWSGDGAALDFGLKMSVNEVHRMMQKGTRVIMTKGYKGEYGVITAQTESRFDFYVVKLENGMNIVVGPSAFNIVENSEGAEN
ncbi:hypothetical protein ACFL9T_11960 [Thermodesulfobacteriota bacterium]